MTKLWVLMFLTAPPTPVYCLIIKVALAMVIDVGVSTSQLVYVGRD